MGSNTINLNFSQALDLLKSGGQLARAGWNGKGLWLFLVRAHAWGMGDEVPFDWGQEGNDLGDWIGIKSADNRFVPWQPSQTDVMADDWQLFQAEVPA